MLARRDNLDRIYDFLSRRPVYHTLFWVAVYGCLVAIDYRKNEDWKLAVTNELVGIVFYAAMVYTNLRFLIPRYWSRSVPVYIISVAVLAALVTPIQVLALYLKFIDEPFYRNSIVEQQGYFYLANVLMAMLSTELHVVMDWWRYQKTKQEMVTQNMESELRFLKSQINPHFLFNTLNNLYALTLKKSDQASEIVLKLSEIMRYMLYECNEDRVLLAKEIQYMNNYLDLERLRQPKAAEIILTTEGPISEQLVAPLMFVPFVENAFKHGLNHQIHGGGYVRIHFKLDGDRLIFTCANSKVEKLPDTVQARSGGIGLSNVRQRLAMLYPEKYVLKIDDAPDRYEAILVLQLDA